MKINHRKYLSICQKIQKHLLALAELRKKAMQQEKSKQTASISTATGAKSATAASASTSPRDAADGWRGNGSGGGYNDDDDDNNDGDNEGLGRDAHRSKRQKTNGRLSTSNPTTPTRAKQRSAGEGGAATPPATPSAAVSTTTEAESSSKRSSGRRIRQVQRKGMVPSEMIPDDDTWGMKTPAPPERPRVKPQQLKLPFDRKGKEHASPGSAAARGSKSPHNIPIDPALSRDKNKDKATGFSPGLTPDGRSPNSIPPVVESTESEDSAPLWSLSNNVPPPASPKPPQPLSSGRRAASISEVRLQERLKMLGVPVSDDEEEQSREATARERRDQTFTASSTTLVGNTRLDDDNDADEDNNYNEDKEPKVAAPADIPVPPTITPPLKTSATPVPPAPVEFVYIVVKAREPVLQLENWVPEGGRFMDKTLEQVVQGALKPRPDSDVPGVHLTLRLPDRVVKWVVERGNEAQFRAGKTLFNNEIRRSLSRIKERPLQVEIRIESLAGFIEEDSEGAEEEVDFDW